jgi:mRNA deadenylase 3'-5' endonuclease subunit Ccr4
MYLNEIGFEDVDWIQVSMLVDYIGTVASRNRGTGQAFKEAVSKKSFSETLVTTDKVTWNHNPEDHNLNSCCWQSPY